MKKKNLYLSSFPIVVCLLLLIFISGCINRTGVKIDQIENSSTQTKDAEKKTASTSKKKIALVMKTLTNPFFIEMEKGARLAENEFGIELIVKTGTKETSIDEQVSIVEELTQKKVDAIVIAPGGSELIPVLKKAQEAGITIVNIDNKLDPELAQHWRLTNIPFISVNNEQSAYLSAKFICDMIHSPTEAVILEGIRGATNAEDRKKGALRAFRENNNIKLVDIQTANWKIDEAYQVISKLYKQHPDIGAIFCANDMMALGAIRYLQDNHIKGVYIAAYDALDEAKTAIKEGWLTVTVNQHADIQGYLGVKLANDILLGREPASSKEQIIEANLIHIGDLEFSK